MDHRPNERRESEPPTAISSIDHASRNPDVWLSIHQEGRVHTSALQEGSSLVLGRGNAADISIDDPRVSRVHSRLWHDGERAYVEDLGSSNGTFINGHRVRGPRVLRHGDQVTVGHVAIWLHARANPLVGVLDGIETHDRFLGALDTELARAEQFRRSFGLLMIRPSKATDSFLSTTCPRVRERVRSVDRMALYARDIIEVMLVEMNRHEVEGLARQFLKETRPDEPPLLCGLAMYPDAALSAAELIQVGRWSLAEASIEQPLGVAASRARTGQPIPRGEPNEPVVISTKMNHVFETARRAGQLSMPVLVTGETGVGKEVVAQTIHRSGPRANERIVSVNCGAIAQHLVESVLFGHERGAFTGAHERQIGVFEAADGGTLFLDEVAELSPSAQVALLRVLETRRITRVGSTKEIEVDARIVAATNRELEGYCAEGHFRYDLMYRLNPIVIAVPPLRERAEEILPLANYFLRRVGELEGFPIDGISKDAEELLLDHPWPGNLRELRNVIEHAAVNTRGRSIQARHLTQRIRKRRRDQTLEMEIVEEGAPRPATVPPPTTNLKERVRAYERQIIIQTLVATEWNQSEAARRLEMPVRTLTNRLRALGIERPGRYRTITES